MIRRRGFALVCATAALAVVVVPANATSHAGSAAAPCPAAPSVASMPGPSQLRQLNSFVADLGVRPTGSDAQLKYIEWIERHLHAIPGVTLSEQPFTFDRWTESGATLRMRVGGQWQNLPVAAAVDYAKPTGADGVAAPLVVVPDSQAINAANSRGKIIIRQADAGSVAQAAFFLPVVSYDIYDPHHTISPLDTFYGDFINYNNRVQDLKDAAAAGAAGLLFVKNLPRAQILRHYEPYEGINWGVPGLWLGADEGKRLTDAIAAGKNPTAEIVLRAHFDRTVTKTVLATIPGQGPQRIVVDSHTDGTNAVEDNGPVAMIAMARYLAALPKRCRPRTIEFAFSTAHFYQRIVSPTTRNGGAEAVAERLDRQYDQGSVSAVVTLEHLGVLDYAAVPRTNGPGAVLKQTGQRSIQEIAITPSPVLVKAVDDIVRRYDLDRTILLQGADAPGATTPTHCNFGGEGTPFNKHLLPTVGEIAAPQTLYDPAFGLEGIDFKVMQSETLAFTALLLQMGTMSQLDVAGAVPAERALRAAGFPTCPTEIK